MARWEVMHDFDDDDGNPTMLCREVATNYYVYIQRYPRFYVVGTVDRDVRCCKSLAAAKRWVAHNISMIKDMMGVCG